MQSVEMPQYCSKSSEVLKRTYGILTALERSDRFPRHQPAVHRFAIHHPPYSTYTGDGVVQAFSRFELYPRYFPLAPTGLDEAKHLLFRRPLQTLLTPLRILLLPVVARHSLNGRFGRYVPDIGGWAGEVGPVRLAEESVLTLLEST